MDEQQSKIQEDLRGLIAGDVRCDDVYTQMFASDASIYQIRPLGVVRPRSTADVVSCVKYAREHQIPLHARGAGTGLAGESLGAGLVLDFSRYMRRTLNVEGNLVRVQPGLVLERLNANLKPHGRWFGTDPATMSVTTIGSVIAIDAAGSHSLKYGSARSRIRSLQVVLSDGEVMELGRESLAAISESGQNVRRRDIISQVADLVQQNHPAILKNRSRAPFNCAGYYLDILDETHVDLARLLVGSEGTLAIVTEATVETAPLPGARGVALLFFDRLDTAARAALELLPLAPSACDLMDRRLLSLARDTDPRFDLLIPAAAEAALLVEQEGDNEAEARAKIDQVVDRMTREKRLVFASQSSTDPLEVELFWQLAGKVVPRLYRLKGTTRPVPFVEDMAVPPAALPGFLTQLQNVLKKHQVTASLFAHAGHGQLHVRPFIDLTQASAAQTLSRLAEDLYEEVFAVGGTISGEHGDGLSRTPYVQQQYGDLYRVFREVKRIFDPHNIFNPGKIVGDDPDLATRNLRPVTQNQPQVTPGSLPVVVPLQLDWTAAEVALAARACNGCGRCRTQEPEFRMCPIFRFAPGEEASPRAKANLMRSVMTGSLPPTAMAGDDFKAVADLCVNCKMCKLECPASVDIPKLMLEAKANYVAVNGLKAGDWVISRLDLWSSLGSLISPLANWAIGNRQARWFIEKLFGIAHGRKLPRFNGRTFMRRAARRRLTRPTRRTGPKVLFFVDSYANYHDPLLAEALVALLEHHGIAVYVHPGQATSGMPLVALGVLDRAREIARQNVTLLAEGVRQGYTIVTAEPSAALALTQEYQSLLDDPDARLVAENTVEACAYLWKLHREGLLKRDLKPIPATLAYHQPCHLRALGAGSPGESLLSLIPELVIKSVDHGCSGMAGTFGLKRENYRSSLRAGWELISSFRDPTIQGGVTECSACKMQMEQGTEKPTVHPLKLLALSYGLLPAGRSILSAKSQELIVT